MIESQSNGVQQLVYDGVQDGVVLVSSITDPFRASIGRRSCLSGLKTHPYDESIAGRDAVVASWLGRSASGDASTRDEPGTYEAEYPVAVYGDTVVVTGTSQYREAPDGPIVRTYENCFIIRFDTEGRCREFIGYYLRRP